VHWFNSFVQGFVITIKIRQPCYSCFAGVALVANHRVNTVQAVPACAQDVRPGTLPIAVY